MDYNSLMSSRVMQTEPSGIRKFFDLVSGREDVVALTIGEPDFVTPWHIREAAIKSLEEGKTYYTPNNGLLTLRKEIDRYLSRRFGLTYDPAHEIIVTVGGSEAIDIALRAMLNPGDEVIIPEPSFVCYKPITIIAGGTPVPIRTKASDKFKLTPEALKAAITPKTKALVLPYPNNPTGAVLERHELEALAKIIKDAGIFVLSDEIYAELTYGKKHVSIASLDGMKERTVLVSGFSKAYAMTGWRLGYLCAPEELTYQMYKIHQYGIMCAPTQSQFAAIEALSNGDTDIERMRDEYNLRRKIILKGLRDTGLECFEPEGAFYVFPKISGFGLSGEDFCKRLLNERNIAIVPGDAFGEAGVGHARISYAYSMRHIEKALDGIRKFINTL